MGAKTANTGLKNCKLARAWFGLSRLLELRVSARRLRCSAAHCGAFLRAATSRSVRQGNELATRIPLLLRVCYS
jgi:hypothetical protein